MIKKVVLSSCAMLLISGCGGGLSSGGGNTDDVGSPSVPGSTPDNSIPQTPDNSNNNTPNTPAVTNRVPINTPQEVDVTGPLSFSDKYGIYPGATRAKVQNFTGEQSETFQIYDISSGSEFALPDKVSGYHLTLNKDDESDRTVRNAAGQDITYDLFSSGPKGRFQNDGTFQVAHVFLDEGSSFENNGTLKFIPRISQNKNDLEFFKGIELTRGPERKRTPYRNTLQVHGSFSSNEPVSFEPNQLVSIQGNVDADIIIDGGNFEAHAIRPGTVRSLVAKDGKGAPYFYATIDSMAPEKVLLKAGRFELTPNSIIQGNLGFYTPHEEFKEYVLVEASESLVVPQNALANSKLPLDGDEGSYYYVDGKRLMMHFKVHLDENSRIKFPYQMTDNDITIGVESRQSSTAKKTQKALTFNDLFSPVNKVILGDFERFSSKKESKLNALKLVPWLGIFSERHSEGGMNEASSVGMVCGKTAVRFGKMNVFAENNVFKARSIAVHHAGNIVNGLTYGVQYQYISPEEKDVREDGQRLGAGLEWEKVCLNLLSASRYSLSGAWNILSGLDERANLALPPYREKKGKRGVNMSFGLRAEYAYSARGVNVYVSGALVNSWEAIVSGGFKISF